MDQKQLNGKFTPIGGMYPAKLMYSEEDIKAMVGRLGQRVSQDYAGEKLLLISILKGSFVFLSDLVRTIDLPVIVEFIRCSSYGNGTVSSGDVKIVQDVNCDIKGRHVLLVEDIVDTGFTLKIIYQLLKEREPASLEICTAFDKPSRRKVVLEPKYVGIEVPDEFIVGYGTDYQDYYRNLSGVYAARPVQANN